MKQNRYRALLFATLSIVYTTVFCQAVAMTVVANDVMAEMALSPEQAGILGSAYFYAYAAIILFAGIIGSWLGPRRTLTVTYLISGFGGLLFAYSSSFTTAFIGRGLSAFGMGVTMPTTFLLFNRWFTHDAFPRLCSWFFSIGGLGAFAGNYFLPFVNEWWGWRGVFGFLAVLTLIFAALIFFVVRDAPDVSDQPTENIPATATFAELRRGIAQIARRKDFWRICLWLALMNGCYFALAGLWAVPFIEDVYGFSRSSAGAMVSLIALGLIIGTPAIAWFCTNILHSLRAGLGLAGLAALFGTAALIPVIDELPTPVLYIVLFASGVVLNAPNVLAYTSLRNLFGPQLAGATSGALACSSFLGGAVMQAFCGALLTYAQNHSWETAEAYALTFSPFMLCGLAGAWCGFKLSPESFTQKKGFPSPK